MVERLIALAASNMPMLLVALAALSTFVVCLGLYFVLEVSQKAEVKARLGAYVGPSQRSKPAGAPNQSRGRRQASSFTANMARELARADVKLTPSEFMGIHAAAALIGFAVGLVLMRQPSLALLLAVGGLFAPRLYLGYLQGKRLGAFNSQLSDTLVLTANSLRSGYSLLQALEVASRESPQPTADEFGRVVWEVSLGLSPEEALQNLVERMGSEDLGLMVTAINVQHEVGGNLARILDSISGTIRERTRIKGEIKSLTAQQQLTGYVISLLPVIVGGVMFVLNPSYMGQLFSMQRIVCMPVVGLAVLAGVLMTVGFIVMQKVVAIDV